MGMAEGWIRFGMEADLLVSVPAPKSRQRQRGYNQSAVLARALSERIGIPFCPQALHRVRSTPSQIGLDRKDRWGNVRGAFVADPRWAGGKQIAVVDDVCTSGATLEACAAALYEAGARSVWGFTLARVIQRALRSEKLVQVVPCPTEGTISRILCEGGTKKWS